MKLEIPMHTVGTLKSIAIVEAKKLGVFAVHTTPGFTDLYTLTHIRSGRAVARDLCCEDSARALAAAIKAFNWDFDMKRDVRVRKFDRPQEFEMKQAAAIVLAWKCPVHGK